MKHEPRNMKQVYKSQIKSKKLIGHETRNMKQVDKS